MKGLENQAYLAAWIISNVLALLFFGCALKWPRVARLLFFLLFSWACWMNWTTSQKSPGDYLQYADMNLISWYGDFINGWFSHHIKWVVGIIASCQGLIAVSMLLKGWIYKLGCIGGILFLLAIAPLGVGSGFPCTIILAAGLSLLFRKGKDYVWGKKHFQFEKW